MFVKQCLSLNYRPDPLVPDLKAIDNYCKLGKYLFSTRAKIYQNMVADKNETGRNMVDKSANMMKA